MYNVHIKDLFGRVHNPSHLTFIQMFLNMPFVYYLKIFIYSAQLGRPGIRVARLWICKFVNNKQVALLQIFVSQQLLFLFSKHLDTMSKVTDCVPGQTDL